MYAGMWRDISQGSFPFGNRYAVEFSMLLVAPPGQHPDPQQYPIAMANEPTPNSQANATLKEWIFDRSEIDGVPTNVTDSQFHGIGLVACKRIPKNTEITWHYGLTYNPIRDYQAGEEIRCTTNEHPHQVLGHNLPYNSVSPLLSSPSASDDEDDDPTYTSTWAAEVKLSCMRSSRYAHAKYNEPLCNQYLRHKVDRTF